MTKTFILLLTLTIYAFADQPVKCDRCFIGKEYMRCSYYVEKKGDLSKQNTCLTYADSLLRGESPGRASWYYIIGGNLDKAIEAGKKALERKEYFALEHLAEAYLLKNDTAKAKKYFTLLKEKSLQNEAFMTKHFKILSKLYPKTFHQKEAEKLAGN